MAQEIDGLYPFSIVLAIIYYKPTHYKAVNYLPGNVQILKQVLKNLLNLTQHFIVSLFNLNAGDVF